MLCAATALPSSAPVPGALPDCATVQMVEPAGTAPASRLAFDRPNYDHVLVQLAIASACRLHVAVSTPTCFARRPAVRTAGDNGAAGKYAKATKTQLASLGRHYSGGCMTNLPSTLNRSKKRAARCRPMAQICRFAAPLSTDKSVIEACPRYRRQAARPYGGDPCLSRGRHA